MVIAKIHFIIIVSIIKFMVFIIIIAKPTIKVSINKIIIIDFKIELVKESIVTLIIMEYLKTIINPM